MIANRVRGLNLLHCILQGMMVLALFWLWRSVILLFEHTTVGFEANRYLAHYQRLVAELLPDVGDEEILIRILAAWHLVAGMCTDLPDIPFATLSTTLTQRMLVTLLAEI